MLSNRALDGCPPELTAKAASPGSSVKNATASRMSAAPESEAPCIRLASHGRLIMDGKSGGKSDGTAKFPLFDGLPSVRQIQPDQRRCVGRNDPTPVFQPATDFPPIAVCAGTPPNNRRPQPNPRPINTSPTTKTLRCTQHGLRRNRKDAINAVYHTDLLITGHIRERLTIAIRPDNLQRRGRGILSQSKHQTSGIAAVIAVAS